MTSINGPYDEEEYSINKKYIINGLICFKKIFRGEYIDEKYYKGKEFMYYNEDVDYYFERRRIIRIYDNGKIKKCTNK